MVSEVYQKIPVIVLDRVVEGYDYSLFIGPDNDLIGKQAGEAAVRLVRGSAAKVLELKGGPHSRRAPSAAADSARSPPFSRSLRSSRSRWKTSRATRRRTW